MFFFVRLESPPFLRVFLDLLESLSLPRLTPSGLSTIIFCGVVDDDAAPADDDDDDGNNTGML